MTLQQPWFITPAVVAFFAFVIWKTHGSNDNWERVLKPDVFRYFTGTHSVLRKRSTALLVAAIGFLAMSSPSLLKKNTENTRHSEAWFVLADLSRSMTLNDIAPSRLSAMRDTALHISSRVNSNSIALIIYAGDTFLATPPSFDNTSFNSHVALLDYGLIPTDGSNLTRALSLVLSITESTSLVNARVLILSDSGGMNNRSQAAISRLRKSGHRTDIVLFGSENGSSSAPFDLETAQKLSSAGGGKTIVTDSFGGVSLDTLSLGKLEFSSHLLTQTGLSTLRLANLSHWILLFAIPFVLLLFYREKP